MSKFRHPHLTRGIVYTSAGAFMLRRGIVDAPDAIGEQLGWLPVDEDPSPLRASSPVHGDPKTQDRLAG